MRLAKSVLAASAFALALGAAHAADDKERKGFNDMDRNADGQLTRAEAKGNKHLLERWKEADKNNDGTLSRAEYLAVMARKDANTVREKVRDAGREVRDEVKEAQRRAPKGDASTGTTSREAAKPK